ncbi:MULTISPECIES: hypothetical protein [unclassified Candidatus Frackibacter]|uniref:hypothetical protein n=1 Tax=unclassified Candidatus Frackibacter TaxID=2648818 RepID=UPI000880E112|nr:MULTISPECIES: hypothetical protein [unclassified Candidatus Frackibacter]SDC27825.1 hypothetical protein SAMN04515661_10588 [Candidatus Frackibacter sp. WG11]SEM54718.1 hypothetical protein SAMN04488698_10689 [Candidatus Frackibacter sp. WG12]SFL53649.1 hypothetical protein SAMN04488699_1055 [Candidatus Frackibacter sp. WG13]
MNKKIKGLIDKRYKRITGTDGIISIANLQQMILAKLGIQVDRIKIKEYLEQHPNLLPLTVNQFICYDYFSNIFWNFIAYKTSLKDIKEFLSELYSVLKEVKVEILLEAFCPEFLEFIKGEYTTPLQVRKNEDIYTIKSEEDFVDFGMDYGYVSADMVKEYMNRYNVDESSDQFELVTYLNEKNIDYSSNSNGEKILKDDKKFIKNYYALQDVEYSKDNNVLLVDLRLNELLALLFLMQDEQKLMKKLENASRHKYKHDLVRLSLIDQNLSPTKKGEKLSDAIIELIYEYMNYKDIITIKKENYSINELCKSKPIKKLQHNEEFLNDAAPYLRRHFLSLPAVKLFVNWIKTINKQGKNSMFDIFQYLIKNEHYSELEWLLIGKKPSCGLKPIRKGTEVCINCKKHVSSCCLTPELNSLNDKKEYLLNLRNQKIKKYIAEMKEDNYEMIKKPIYIKFLAPYCLVVRVKIFMRKIGILKSTNNILYKDSGKYCPIEDKWEIDNYDILV